MSASSAGVAGRVTTVWRRAAAGAANRAIPRAALAADAAGVLIVASLLVTPWLPYPLLHNGLLAPLFALLVFGLATGEGMLSRALAGRRAILLGGASYAMYLLHVPLLAYADRVVADTGLEWTSPWMRAWVSGLAVISVSIGVLVAVEEPARHLLRSMLKTPPRSLDRAAVGRGDRTPTSESPASGGAAGFVRDGTWSSGDGGSA